MYLNETQIRVRYAETDQMGYVYYGHYAAYFEVARVEMLRSLGFSYKILEEEGLILPVLNFSIKYIRPAFTTIFSKLKLLSKNYPLPAFVLTMKRLMKNKNYLKLLKLH